MIVLNEQHSDWFEIEALNATNVANNKMNFDYQHSYGADTERATNHQRAASGWSGPNGGIRDTHNDKFITKMYECPNPAAIDAGAGVKVVIKSDL